MLHRPVMLSVSEIDVLYRDNGHSVLIEISRRALRLRTCFLALGSQQLRSLDQLSVQDGMLLRSNMHDLFDNYFVSINPDVCFFIAGKL